MVGKKTPVKTTVREKKSLYLKKSLIPRGSDFVAFYNYAMGTLF